MLRRPNFPAYRAFYFLGLCFVMEGAFFPCNRRAKKRADPERRLFLFYSIKSRRRNPWAVGKPPCRIRLFYRPFYTKRTAVPKPLHRDVPPLRPGLLFHRRPMKSAAASQTYILYFRFPARSGVYAASLKNPRGKSANFFVLCVLCKKMTLRGINYQTGLKEVGKCGTWRKPIGIMGRCFASSTAFAAARRRPSG